MKGKKLGLITFMALFLLAASFFHYDGFKSRADADVKTNEDQQDQISSKEISDNNELIKENIQIEDASGEDETEIVKTDIDDSESQLEKVESSKETNKEAELSKEELSKSDVKTEKAKDVFKYAGEVYVSLMNDDRYKDMIAVAKQNNAKLYTIPSSDLFLIAKDGEVICQMSTGIIGAIPEYSHLIADLSSDEFLGLEDNLKFVKDTGATVTVELKSDITYAVYERDKKIVFSY
ncbi:hypothetical protein [Metabacillus halosaccharovorans]|uniref:hypothetical protein n=1 Tax=Metabacillus halosaccharovorans TaxID=930124 RepID=UPI001C200722|nr:hypothetical protein [Metabacillus halosaccharovorans]MBU7594485.1 hypothetical protein [Metabacillus halosaccharovorans]